MMLAAYYNADTRLRTLVALGTFHGLESLVDIARRGTALKGITSLDLVYLFTPLILLQRHPALKWLAATLCLFDALRSGLALIGSIAAFSFNPMTFTVHLFGTPVWTLWHPGSQFVYFFLRAALFGACGAALICHAAEPNKSPEPTTTSVMPAAEQPSRRP